MFNCNDTRCECCNYLMINDLYTFKNFQTTFKLKNRFTCDSSSLIHVVNCDECKAEYIGETWEGYSLGKALIKTKHNREIVVKICPKMKLTPSCTPLPSTTKELRKMRLHVAFTFLLIKCKKFFEQTKL